MNAKTSALHIDEFWWIHTKTQLLALAIILLMATKILAADSFVAVDGSDQNDGRSLATPFATLQKAVDLAGPGDTVYVRGGTYRQMVTATQGGGTADAYLTITAYQDEIPVFKGSDIVTGWEHHEGAIWKKTGWTINSQQVFCNERPLQQIGPTRLGYVLSNVYVPVGSGTGDLRPGSFHYDSTTEVLYAWLPESLDPNTATMEASIRGWSFSTRDIPFIHIKNLTFRHSNWSQWFFSASQAALVHLGPDSIIENCDIQWGDFGGLLLKSRSKALGCVISNNGCVGVGAANNSEDILVRKCVIEWNNYRNFNPMWHAGGLKMVSNISGTVEGCEINHNNGNGIWFDTCKNGNSIIVRNNRVHDHQWRSIFIEASNNAIVYNNLITDANEFSICITGSDNTLCYNNTIVETSGHAAIFLGGVPRTNCTLKNNRVFNNIIFGSTSAFDIVIPMDNGGDTEGNLSNNNCFYRRHGIPIFSSSGQTYFSLATWRTATGNDLNSISVDPQFNLTTVNDYSTSTISPVVDVGIDLSEVPDDIRGVPRPAGASSDMGAYETAWLDSEPPTEPTNVSAQPVSWHGAVVTWSASTDNVKVTSYEVFRDGDHRASTTATEFTDDGLSPLTTYQYCVVAMDRAGLSSGMSGVVEVTTGPPPDTVSPSTPSRPDGLANSAREIFIEWDAAWDNVGVTEYCVFRDGERIRFTRETNLTDSGLNAETGYEYRVSALDAAGNESPRSSSRRVKTLATFASVYPTDSGGPIADATGGWAGTSTTFTFSVPHDFAVTTVRLRLSASHARVTDLTARLVAPDGTRIVLFSGIGGDPGASTDSYFEDVEFRDDAAEAIGKTARFWRPSTNAGPWSGMFRPESASLSAFIGVQALGTWRLVITDYARQATGYVYARNDDTDLVPSKQPRFSLTDGTMLILLSAERMLSPFEEWRVTHFGSSPNSDDATATVDTDLDGIPNLIEYALGRDPNSSMGNDGPAALPVPEADTLNDCLVLVIDLPSPTPADVVYQVWATSDLANWTMIARKPGSGLWIELGAAVTADPIVNGRQIIRVHDTERMSSTPRRMMSLGVSPLP